ncbi:sigma-70 family RNA polymerase sigma factor [Paucilactobacillus sp. N302-9]
MKNFIEYEVSDAELIDQFITGNPNSFAELFERYTPLVAKYHRQYHFQHIDKDDWYQEARIVLLKTCRRYKKENGVHFAYYFKMNLRNRVFDLIRQENAKKRVKDSQQVSLEQDEEKQAEILVDTCHCMPDERLFCDDQMQEFLTHCSRFEKAVFSLLSSGYLPEKIANVLKCEPTKVKRAIDRCRWKLNDVLN